MSNKEGRHVPYRSQALDLLFPDTQAARVRDITSFLETPSQCPATQGLHRVTLFLTYGCNLACPYCKTIVHAPDDLLLAPQKASVITLPLFTRLLDTLDPTRIAHLHFTGGEPTLCRELPAMIHMAKAAGVRACSLTSNGTLPWRIYEAIIDAGVDEIRISLDSWNPATGAVMSGRRHVWAKAVATIQALVAAQPLSPSFFLIANAVIADTNREEMAEIVAFLLALGVGDIRLLSVAAQKETLWDFPGAPAHLARIREHLAPYPETRYPLLRTKLAPVVAKFSKEFGEATSKEMFAELERIRAKK